MLLSDLVKDAETRAFSRNEIDAATKDIYRQIQQRILEGESTGNPAKDISIVLSSSNPKTYEPFFQNLHSKIENQLDSPLLFVRCQKKRPIVGCAMTKPLFGREQYKFSYFLTKSIPFKVYNGEKSLVDFYGDLSSGVGLEFPSSFVHFEYVPFKKFDGWEYGDDNLKLPATQFAYIPEISEVLKSRGLRLNQSGTKTLNVYVGDEVENHFSKKQMPFFSGDMMQQIYEDGLYLLK